MRVGTPSVNALYQASCQSARKFCQVSASNCFQLGGLDQGVNLCWGWILGVWFIAECWQELSENLHEVRIGFNRWNPCCLLKKRLRSDYRAFPGLACRGLEAFIGLLLILFSRCVDVKDLYMLKNARALQFCKHLFYKVKAALFLGETPIAPWVKHRVHPQANLGETPCLSTGQTINPGETRIYPQGVISLGETPIAITVPVFPARHGQAVLCRVCRT